MDKNNCISCNTYLYTCMHSEILKLKGPRQKETYLHIQLTVLLLPMTSKLAVTKQ